jgi:hypothetical protein
MKGVMMALVIMSSNAVADILAGEMALANSVSDDHIRSVKRSQIQMITYSIADRFAQATPVQGDGLDPEQRFGRAKFYARAGLRANGELL